ncbi:thioredoxin family protein [Haloflavibacter putidus]|uniref:Thioredoxin family protein n=1 Tax=Haloflavibacter putidus TaxID=2576776 RepID=A0A507ZPX4_9FLAO|nr:thioredoxin family protein [Haloflavibacter putidus]TQD38553.1 thioredoxin family protein [Haloflavibacter putidus]
MDTQVLNTEIIDALKKSMTYEEFQNMVAKLYEDGKVTGDEQTEDLMNYTELNLRRIKRWNKTLKVNEPEREVFENNGREVYWIVIAEGWCGDVAHSLPVINKAAELNEKIDLRIVLRDKNVSLMDHFLTNGARSIPKLLMVDKETLEVLNVWGERPAPAKKLIKDYKQEHGKVDNYIKEELQRWYNTDKGQTALKELANSMS